jgi:diaminopimelate epimerase
MTFYKYQGTGNDFIIVDNRETCFTFNESQIAQYCHRKYGVGADGFILLEKDSEVDFSMIYYNSDGKESSMCGNGGRCIVAFAYHLGIIKQKTVFKAIDGLHEAIVEENEYIKLKMIDVSNVSENDFGIQLNTGSPHIIVFKNSLENIDIVKEARKIRNHDSYVQKGINVNFVVENTDDLTIRTYERGVEDETLSCGTGVTAAVIASHFKHKSNVNFYSKEIHTQGGTLKVSFNIHEGKYQDVWLEGPAVKVFEGKITW